MEKSEGPSAEFIKMILKGPPYPRPDRPDEAFSLATARKLSSNTALAQRFREAVAPIWGKDSWELDHDDPVIKQALQDCDAARKDITEAILAIEPNISPINLGQTRMIFCHWARGVRNLASFVSTKELVTQQQLRNPRLVVVDGSWYLPTQSRDGFQEYLAKHIPGAVFFDIDEIADHSQALPHMLPPPDVFALHMTRLGIENDSKVVVYDSAGLFSAARVWWTLRVFGMKDVSVLEGGLPKWIAEGRPVEAGMVTREPTHFSATLDASKVADLDRMKKTLVDRSAQIVDSRAADRFRGEAPEPRPGVRAGHMPGSLNVPYTKLLDGGRLADAETIRKAFADGAVDLDKPVITSCGSGVNAAITWLALEAIGKEPEALYDGSWTEWGSNEELPVATGAK